LHDKTLHSPQASDFCNKNVMPLLSITDAEDHKQYQDGNIWCKLLAMTLGPYLIGGGTRSLLLIWKGAMVE